MKRLVSVLIIVSLFPLIVFCSTQKSMDGMSLDGFTSLFDGKTLDGWRKLTEYSGDDGKWEVVDLAHTSGINRSGT